MCTDGVSNNTDTVSKRTDKVSNNTDGVSNRLDTVSNNTDTVSSNTDTVSNRLDTVSKRTGTLVARRSPPLSNSGTVSPMTGNDVDDQVASQLRDADQRYTTSRKRLVAALQAGDGPLTITQIVETDQTLPQSTVYRNLTVLEEVGIVARIVTSDDFARYELAEHLTEHHHHLICTACGHVADFSLDATTETALDQALETAASQAGFSADTHRLDLLGTCEDCTP